MERTHAHREKVMQEDSENGAICQPKEEKPVLPNLSLELWASKMGGHKGVYLQPHNLCFLVRTSISDQYRLSIEVIFDIWLGDTHMKKSIPEKYVHISGL